MCGMGDKIKKLRIDAGLTQSQTAERLGISTSTVGMYEHGRRRPDNEMLIKIGKLFSVTTDYLLGLDEQSNEATEIIEKMSSRIRNGKGITLKGIPMSIEDKEKLLYTIEVATNMLLNEKKNKVKKEN